MDQPESNEAERSAAEKDVVAAVAAFEAKASRPGNRPEALHEMIAAMHRVCGALSRAQAAGIPDSLLHDLARKARETAALSPFVARLQSWPRGYPGDFETIEYLMQQEVKAPPASPGYWIELHSLSSAIVQQHRNKVAAQARKIIEQASERDRPRRILVLAAGSSPDIALALPVLANADVSLTLVDSDPDAIAFSRQRLMPLGNKMHTISENVLKVAASLQPLAPFDLILAGGLFDYLPTKYATALIRSSVCDYLAPGGQFFFTNMIAPNPYRGWMRHVANWRVLDRTPEDIRNLIHNACGQQVRTEISTDGTGLALLVECTKLKS